MIIKSEGLTNTMKQYKEILDISKGIKMVVIRLKQLDFFSQLTRGKMKTQPEKLVANNFKIYIQKIRKKFGKPRRGILRENFIQICVLFIENIKLKAK